MNTLIKLKQGILLVGDLLILYAALTLMLLMRYGYATHEYEYLSSVHFETFSVIFIFWLFVFYIVGLYDLKTQKNDLLFIKKWAVALSVGAIFAVIFFYLVPAIITPKTNLFLFLAIFCALETFWRYVYNLILGSKASKEQILLVGSGPVTEELAAEIEKNPQLGYAIGFWMREGFKDKEFDHIAQIILANKISTIVVPSHIKRDLRGARLIYRYLSVGLEVIDIATLYERIFQKVPLMETEEVWFLENIAEHRRFYDAVLPPVEKVTALVMLLTLLPLTSVIALLIKITSRGPAIIKQTRVGKNGLRFTLYKFRSMYKDAEKNGPEWAKQGDKRTTPLGTFLRYTHLDELPQLWNIFKGDLSFVGPRPERPEFVDILKKEIDFYELRHIVNPGVTGWAQINYRYGASVEDAYQKLQYDLYYLKHRSMILDIATTIRTLKLLFIKII